MKAQHLLLKKEVAIKFVTSSRRGAAERRLFREGRAAQALSSEHVVRVFDIGLHEEAPYIVMELLEGCDLAEHVHARGPLPVAEAVDLILEACVAVAEAHAAGIIHRDLKPANLFLARTATRDLVKVLDFGISKVPPVAEHEDPDKTAEDAVLGTPHYASPEQLRNPTAIDGRADVWSLGVTLYYLLSKEHPFPGATGREVIAATFGDPPRSLLERRPEVPVELWQVIERTLAKRPEARIASVTQLAAALEPFASKRGALAAQQTIERGASSPRAPERATNEDLVERDTTEERMSSTLPSTAADGSAGGREPARLASSRWRLPVLAAGAVAAAVAAFWQLRAPAVSGSELESETAGSEPARSPEPDDASSATRIPAEPAAAAPAAVSAAVEPVVEARFDSPPRSSPSSIQRPSAAVPALSSPAVSTSAVASPDASAPPPSAPVRRDIDGVPIVE